MSKMRINSLLRDKVKLGATYASALAVLRHSGSLAWKVIVDDDVVATPTMCHEFERTLN